MPPFSRHFTLAEANGLLPWIWSIFAQVRMIQGELARELPPAPLPPTNGNGHGNGRGNGHKLEQVDGVAPPEAEPAAEPAAGAGLDGKALWTDLPREQKRAMVERLLKMLADEGILIRDVKRGLVDFPAWRQNEEVLLCYELRDGPRIAWWHPLEEGYGARRPIDEGFEG